MVSVQVDDLAMTYFTPSQIQTWLNNGQREVQKKLLQSPGNWYVTPVNTPTVQNQAIYALPADYLKCHRIEIVLSGTTPNEVKSPLDVITINEQDLFPNGPGNPGAYYLFKNNINLVPIPSTAGQTIRLYYSYLVADMVLSNDVPDVPYQYEELIAWYAIRDAFIKDQREMGEVQKKIDVYEAMMKEDMQQRDVSRGRRIVTTETGGWNNACY